MPKKTLPMIANGWEGALSAITAIVIKLLSTADIINRAISIHNQLFDRTSTKDKHTYIYRLWAPSLPFLAR